MFSLYFIIFLFALYFAGLDYAISGFTRIQFTMKQSEFENVGFGLIKGLKVRSLPQCASVCASNSNCTAFNFYQPCTSLDNVEINCKLYNNSEADLMYNPCCSYYSMVLEVSKVDEKTTSVTPPEITSEVTKSTPEITPQNDFGDPWNPPAPASNELFEPGSPEDFNNRQPQLFSPAQATSTTTASTTTQSSNIQQIQANSMNDFKVLGSPMQVVPSVQCNKTLNPSICIIKTANWSAANNLCKQYNNGNQGQLNVAVISSDLIDYFLSTILTNSTICPPLCNFWIGLQGVGNPGIIPQGSLIFTWGPWVDESKFEYQNFGTGYPKQIQGNHYVFIQADNGKWGSGTDPTEEKPFLCYGN